MSRLCLVAVCIALGIIAHEAHAQPLTGYELALSGASTVTAGRTSRFRGVAYRVRGVASLEPFAGPVRARFASDDGVEGAWLDVRSRADGGFAIALPIPEDAPVRGARIEVEVGPGGDARRFELPVAIAMPFDVMLRTDRRLYEPGEPVHVWALVRDARSGTPIAGRELEITVEGRAVRTIERTITTAQSGVAELSFELLESAPEGDVGVRLALGPTFVRATSFRVGARTWERLLATVEVSPEPVAPHASATARVEVTTASGAPVAGASVEVTIDGRETYAGTSGPDGIADVSVRAPAYLVHETGVASVRARVRHPAHGSVEARGFMRLAVPLALRIELAPRHGALVPEIDDVLFVRLRDGAGDPPPAGTEVIVEGAAVPGSRASARTDDNGLAEIAVRLPRGSAASGGDGTHTSLVVRVAGPLERLARMPVPVMRAPDVVPTLSRSVLSPGDRVEVALARRPPAVGRPVVVDLIGRRGELLASERAAARARRVTIVLPRDRVGLFAVRARVVSEDESLEGVGAMDALIVRPSQPSFVRVEPERPRFTVGETARLVLHTAPGAPRSFAAVLVRDLAAHGGEEPFRRSFLDHAFDRAVLDPSGPSAARLVRAALAAHVGADAAPPVAGPLIDALGLPAHEAVGRAVSTERGALRDPWPLARELSRRGIGAPMIALEAQLEQALASGGLDALTEGTGAARRFRDEPLEDGETLGGGDLTPSLLSGVDPSFTYEHVARRVARGRLVRLMVRLAHYLDPGEDASPEARMAAREPWARWLPRMVERGVIDASDLADPWGGRFTLRPTRAPIFALSARATRLELVSPGPDGRAGTSDDVRDPFARVVPAGTPYAVASGEDALVRRLAIVSVTERTLAAIADAYTRTNAEVMEEVIGDAVSARVSEGTIGLGSLGLVGHGAGGAGYGSGYGVGRGRRARTPSIRVGRARVSGLARVVRERFPPTLFFDGAIGVDPSGTTEIAVPLADAVTTYLVETIVWREDGWIWSDDARFEVDREIVIDAPVPAVGHVGDRLVLPLRVSNRGDREREVRVQLMPEPALGVAGSAPVALTIAPGGAARVPVRVALDRVGDAPLSVVVTTPSGEALDAVRRPLRVVEPARRVHVERDILAIGEGALAIVVPVGADPRRGRVRLAVGRGMFPAPTTHPWSSWAPGDPRADGAELSSLRGAELAFALGASRRGAGGVQTAIARLSAELDHLGDEDAGLAGRVRARAMSLIGLAPLARDPRVEPLTARLARELSADAAAATEDAESWALAAAALGWSAPDRHAARIAELVRRLERHVVEVGEDRWLPTADAPRATVLLAMAELSLGRRERAFASLRTVARWAALGHPLPSDVSALGRAAADRLMGGEAPSRVSIEIDGEPRHVALRDGAAELDAGSLAAPGRHVVRVALGGGAPLWVRADADYGLPWRVRPARPGPLCMRLEGRTRGAPEGSVWTTGPHCGVAQARGGPSPISRGEGGVGALDAVSELELVVVNRAPRTLPRPIVEIELPTGAELTAADRARMGVSARSIERGEGVLRVRLAPLRPGNEVRVPLRLRWSVAGRLPGFGAVGYAEDRPDDITVLAPREIVIEEAPR